MHFLTSPPIFLGGGGSDPLTWPFRDPVVHCRSSVAEVGGFLYIYELGRATVTED